MYRFFLSSMFLTSPHSISLKAWLPLSFFCGHDLPLHFLSSSCTHFLWDIPSCTYSIVEHSVLGHAVWFAELLDLPSIVAMHHFLSKATAVGTRTQGTLLFVELLTVWSKTRKVLISRINNQTLLLEWVNLVTADSFSDSTLQSFWLFKSPI